MFGRNNLVKIIKKGDLNALKKAVEKNPDIMNQRPAWEMDHGYMDKSSILHIAAYYCQPDMIDYLVREKGMNINSQNATDDWTPLHYMKPKEYVDDKAIATAVKLVTLGANVHLKTKRGRRAYDFVKNVKIKNLVNPQRKIIEAIMNGDIDTVRDEIEKAPDLLHDPVYWQTEHGYNDTSSILHLAAYYNQPEIIDYLVNAKGMDIDNQTTDMKWSPLHYASKNNATESATTLLELGANPSLKTTKGHFAEDLCKDETLKDFLHHYRGEYMAEKIHAEDEIKAEQRRIKAESEWTVMSDDEIMHERTLPGNNYRLTKVFNFASDVCTSITKDLESGQIVPEEKKFEEMADQESIKIARAKLAKTHSKSLTG